MSSRVDPPDYAYELGEQKETPMDEDLRLLSADLVRAEESCRRLRWALVEFLAAHYDMPAHNDERCTQCAEARVALAFEEARHG